MRIRLFSALIAAFIGAAGLHAADGVKGLPEDCDFEICVNGKIIRSSDSGIWKPAGVKKYQAPNGALSTTFVLDGKRQYKGLHVFVDRQTFSDSGLVRERLRLRSDRKGKFRLTNVDGHNHLIFPIRTLDFHCDSASVEEIKLGNFTLRKDKGNHSFFPSRNRFSLTPGGSLEIKGPITRISSSSGEVMHAYEHASQDGDVIQKVRKKPVTDSGVDAAQGITGELYPITDNDLWFIATQISLTEDRQLRICDKIRHGGYLDGENIPAEGYYETVWSVFSPVPADSSFKEVLNDYIFSRISYNPASRKPDFYYNTWGMQRDYPSDQLYSIYTEENILAEIDRAAKMGIERFVLDDGWEQAMGQWTANAERLGEDGLKRLADAIRAKGMTPGIWISPLATTDTSTVFRKHQDWIIKDKAGNPVLGQWNCPVVDLGSPYYYMLLKQLTTLVDMGFKYFKWDGINTFNSTLDGFRGSGAKSPTDKEKIDRYNYQFPFYVTRLMQDLRLHDPEVVVEIDLTENERALIGLMPLQEGKFYYINNGRSKYRDYSHANSDSKREALDSVAGILPPETITLSVYPNDAEGSLKRNVHSVLAAGHGFWGRLDATTPEERAWIRNTLDMAKRVLKHTAGNPLEVWDLSKNEGQTIFQADRDSGFAIITGFYENTMESEITISDLDCPAGVIGCPFRQEGREMTVIFDFDTDKNSAAALVIGAERHTTRILSSSGILSDLHYEGDKLLVTAFTDTELVVTDKDSQASSTRTISLDAGSTLEI